MLARSRLAPTVPSTDTSGSDDDGDMILTSQMLLPRVLGLVRSTSTAALTGQTIHLPCSQAVDAVRVASRALPVLTFVRHATHQATGRANGVKDGPGKRLGAKKTGGRAPERVRIRSC